MRAPFARAMAPYGLKSDYFFLTGDLGFMALEEVQTAFGDRFINAGVAEQNMIGVAAGLAREGYKVFVYSIAPFCYARPFEQIRNDICLGGLPVCLVGNGGGYGYGHMGPTHHALEDCAVMRALGVRVRVPAFDEDLPAILEDMSSPTYLRLGYDVRPKESMVPAYSPWRKVLAGSDGVMAALGPMAGVAWQALLDVPIERRPTLWAVSTLEPEAIPDDFCDAVQDQRLFVVEEHVEAGGLGMHVALALALKGVRARQYSHRGALRYPSGRYGSQNFHRAECGLDAAGIRQLVASV